MLGATNLLTPLSYANAATWYDALTADDLTQNALRFVMPDRDVYLYAHTEANTYVVRYNGNTGAVWSMPDETFTYDDNSKTLSTHTFVKTWYTFSGWNEDQDGNGTGHEENATVFNWTTTRSGIVNIFAQWSSNKYQIKYDLNQGTGTSVPQHGASHPDELDYDKEWTINNPSREWYTFSGWTITGMDTVDHIIGWVESNVSLTGWVMGETFKNLRADDGTVYFAAKWKADDVWYKIEHYLQQLDGNYPATPKDTNSFSWDADEIVTLETHTYSGFRTPATATGQVNPDGNSVFRYKYQRRPYELTLIAGTWVATVSAAGTVSSGGSTSGTTGIKFLYEEPITLSLTLKSWYTTATWSGYSGTAASFTMPYDDITKIAYATTIHYTITWDYHWGQDAESGTVYVKDYTVESDNITLPTMLYRANSIFSWWIGEGITTPQKTVTIENGSVWDKLYEAIWDCEVWYHSWTNQCVANTDTEYTVNHYKQDLDWEGYTFFETETPTPKGTTDTRAVWTGKDYTWFGEWHLTGAEQNINWDGSTVVNVYYDRLSYTWTVDDSDDGIATAGATGQHPAESGKYKYWDTVTLSATTGDGYIFDGWTVTGPDGDVNVTNSGSMNGATFVMPAWEVTITPKTKTHDYTITYYLNNWDYTWWASNPATYTVEDQFTLNNPERADSIFLWWSWSNGSDPQTTVTIAKWTHEDLVYEANWTCRDWYHSSEDGQSCDKNGYDIHVNYGGNGQSSETKHATYDEWTEILNPSRVWYDFSWWTITDMSGNVVHYIGSESTTTEATSANGVMGTGFKNLTTVSWGEVNFLAVWTPRNDTHLTVYHYTENLSGGYTLQTGITYTTWVSDSGIALADYQKSYLWFTYSSWSTTWTEAWPWEIVATTTISANGTTELHLYYSRNGRHVYLSGDAHVTALSWAGAYRFGQEVEVEATVEPWYHFVNWERKADSGFVTPYSGS